MAICVIIRPQRGRRGVTVSLGYETAAAALEAMGIAPSDDESEVVATSDGIEISIFTLRQIARDERTDSHRQG